MSVTVKWKGRACISIEYGILIITKRIGMLEEMYRYYSNTYSVFEKLRNS